MRVTTRRRRWLGILGTWPVVYVVGIVTATWAFQTIGHPLPAPGPRDVLWTWGLVTVHVGTIVLGWVVLIACLVHLLLERRFAAWQKGIWALLLVFGTILTMPIFIWWQVRTDTAGNPDEGEP